jgi:hypothetical protein
MDWAQLQPGAVCLLDTSIFVELVGVPYMCDHQAEVFERLETLVKAKATILVSLATIIETGNHIAQNGDGRQRREVAARFLGVVEEALDGRAPWNIVPLPQPEALRALLKSFADEVHVSDLRGKGRSLGDAALKVEFDHQCRLSPTRQVFIWSFDAGLSALEHTPSPQRRA